jgi:signal transduction histidine kinase
MLDFINDFLSTTAYVPHGYCIGWWSPLVSTFAASDALTAVAYFSIPLALLHFARRRKDFPYPWLLWLCAAFILSCGATHLLDVVVLWIPAYGLSALVKALNAGVSLATAIMVWPMIPEALRLPSAESLRRSNEQLRAEISERQRAEEGLRLRSLELTAANKELESFAYAVSHDLRAPLRAMGGFSRVLSEDFSRELSDEAKGYIEQIALASRNMGLLIDGLLALSRVTRGELDRVEVDLSETARQIRRELDQAEPERRVEWHIEPGIIVSGDPRMFSSMMRNLLDNAWKYTGQMERPTIGVSQEWRDGRRSIVIEDNGAGFDMAHAAQLFQPFRRLHRQDEFPGIGIGLATVLRIVHRHGGVIEAESAPGAGARFRITLPEG